MTGQVWTYDATTRDGSIIGRDKRRYGFSAEDYLGGSALEEGNMVKFRIDKQRARDIKLLV